MKKFLISIICALCVCSAFAAGENVATSKAFVDAAMAQKQDKIPANTNPNNSPDQVLTNTGTAGTVGTKDVYDSSAAYVDQTDALVDAQTMNAAVQNAIEAEFQCIAWVDNDPTKDCLLVNIFSAPQQSILPTGYTALEYLESTGTQYITTTIPWTSVTRFRGKAQQSALRSINEAVIGSSTSHDSYGSFWGTACWGSEGGIQEWYWNTRINPKTIANFDIHRSGDVDWTGIVNGVTTSTLTATRPQSAGYWNFIGDVIIMGTNTPDLNRKFNGKVWYIQLFDNSGVQIFSGVPARRNIDNVVGMYDTVTNTFLTNSGSGDFIAGPVQNLYVPSGS